MNALRKLAISEGFADEAARRKRLGQYFTGTGLARLLAALAGADASPAILDPMAGNGDMLLACRGYGASDAAFAAVEIDPIAESECRRRAPWATTVLGNAFDPAVVRALRLSAWDLVITNPPYVRYQTLARGAGLDFKLPSGAEVRNGLLETVRNSAALDAEDRKLLSELVAGYSGLADLAVPSWLLCAALCAPAGKIALVLPESWLNRDYAAIVQYLLLRWFRIRYLVEDADAAWFADAQVKTTLLVAERVPRRRSAFEWDAADTFLRIRLSRGSIGTGGGVVDRLFPDGAGDPEWRFAEMAGELLKSGRGKRMAAMDAEHVPLVRLAENVRGACARQKWFQKVERSDGAAGRGASPAVPHELSQWLSCTGATPAFTTLEALNAKVGQGLRTGANSFFYVDSVAESPGGVTVKTGAKLGSASFRIPADAAIPALRKQAELPDGYVVEASGLNGRVLSVARYALPEDDPSGTYREMPEGLAELVRLASKTEIDGKPIPQLSAVATNVRPGRLGNGNPARHWYMLPDFADRHFPDLLIARINGGTPKTFLNRNRAASVDANFSTIRVSDESRAGAWALLAMLNSSWCKSAMELSCAVMGGGALKVEAAHVRRIPIPELSAEKWLELAELGRSLSDGDPRAQEKIDSAVASALFGRRAMKEEYVRLSEIGENARVRREGMGRKS